MIALVGCSDKRPAQPDQNYGMEQGDVPESGADSEDNSEEGSDSDSFFPFGEVFYDGRWYGGDMPETEAVSAADIYAKVKYTPQMFYGDYRLNHPKDGIQTSYASRRFLNQAQWTKGEDICSNFAGKMVSSIPYRIVSGNAELDNALITDTQYNWCQIYYAVSGDDNNGVSCDAAFTVDGNVITFTPVINWSYDETTGDLSYTFDDNSISYIFEFCGPKLTLKDDKTEYTLIERDFTSWRSYVTEESVSVESSLSENSKKIDDITGIDMTVALDSVGNLVLKKSTFSLKTDTDGHAGVCNGIAKWDEDGLFTFSYKDQNGETHTHQMVMFYCGFDGLVLSDGKKNYYYLSTFLSEASVNHYTIEDLGANVSEEDVAVLENLTDEEIEEILETRDNLLSDFEEAFSNKGIAAKIDEETGEIILDSSILFATNSAELSADGKAALTAFITAFTEVIGDEKYDGFISKVEVQGHTDTDGDYDFNKELSQERADNVKNYCLSESGISEEVSGKLSNILVPVGYSYDVPVYNADGSVNKDASRRVEFVFYINLAGMQ
jgi:chemotaxis protein MotB